MTEDEPHDLDLSLPPPPERAGLRTRVSGLTRRLGEEARRAAEAGRAAAGEVGGRAADLGRAASMQVGSRAQRVWLPDDPAVILGSATFAPFPAGGPPAEMLSIAWQSDALVALSALGVTQWEREIVTVTRSVFHDNLRHQELSRRLFGSDFDAIHRWIDTVPGSGIRGGGILHRLQHGHDLAAVQQLYDQHGLPGVLVWMQHVAQDVCTPTGIPIPVGGTHLASWLVDSGFTSPGKAALMLSFNAAQLASTLLGGAFALRLATLAAEFRRQRQVARRCAAARDAWARGDLDAVVAHYSEARSLSNNDPTILMSLGWAYAQMGRPAVEAFLAFRAAAHGLAKEDRTAEVDGAALSLRGLAYMLALTHAVQVLEETDLRGPWRAELDRMLRGAIAAFERTALAQTGGPAVRLRDHELALYRQRPLSAAANYYMAARLAWSAPFLPSSSEAPRLTARAIHMLNSAARVHPEGVEDVQRSAERWKLELTGSGGGPCHGGIYASHKINIPQT
jgi:hypothetical protein